MEGDKIRPGFKSYGSYGSTQSKASTDRVVYIEHLVLPNETMTGLAVKYDVPIHNIRRANRLLMNATLYENMKIYIPTKLNPANLTVSDVNGELLVVGDSHAPVKGNSANNQSSTTTATSNNAESLASPQPGSSKSGGMPRQESFHDIFNKVDQTVTAVKGSISNLQKDSDDLFRKSREGLSVDGIFSNRSSSNSSPRIDQQRRVVGVSSNSVNLLVNDDNTDFPL